MCLLPSLSKPKWGNAIVQWLYTNTMHFDYIQWNINYQGVYMSPWRVRVCVCVYVNVYVYTY